MFKFWKKRSQRSVAESNRSKDYGTMAIHERESGALSSGSTPKMAQPRRVYARGSVS